jgi:CubicO group peptidase (beta-lactamase class C family)
MKKTLIILTLIHLFFFSITFGQQELKNKLPINAYLKAGETHTYSFALQKGNIAALSINQSSINVGYKIYAPNDSLIAFADLTATYQNEFEYIKASLNGTYKVQVFWDYSSLKSSGSYSIMMKKISGTTTSYVENAKQYLNAIYNQSTPGAAIAVIENRIPVLTYTKGLANLEHNIPIDANTVFDLASCSKQFTGYAVALLLKDKKINLEDDVRKYITDLPDFGKPIKIKHLIAHTSGLRNWDEVAFMAAYKKHDIIDGDIIMNMIKTQTQLNFEPGDRFSYSNTGYFLLSKIVEKVSGKRYDVYCKDHIFKPLGMSSTFVRYYVTDLIPKLAYSYKASEDAKYDLVPNTWVGTGSSSVCSSLSDLIKWVNHLDYDIKKDEKEILKTLFTTNKGDTLNFHSFGNFFGLYGNQSRIEHLGLVMGYRIAIARFPLLKKSIIYMSNDAMDATYTYYKNLTDFFIPPFKVDAIKDNALPVMKEYLSGNFIDDQVPIYDTDRSKYKGWYYSKELNVSYELVSENNHFFMRHPRIGTVHLKTTASPNEYKAIHNSIWDGEIRFETNPDQSIKGFYLSNGALKPFWCEKVK